ncbi:sensor protein KdpD [mine drainage metagenome]|uniref:Sensor protein KdpD n=1 Tax=mine drainage metagenome TaxID=410659 RepID=A0A1J5RU21_9ZZZZ
MCPGSGKTFAMLRSGMAERENGGTVEIGVLSTHGRPGTESLARILAGASDAVPAREVIDLPGLLARRPSLVLIDDVARENPPTSRHAGRYHDVLELLAAGIDVHVTVDVGEIESRAEAAARISGLTSSSTVPDSLVDDADEIVLVDVPASLFIERRSEARAVMGASADGLPEAHLDERQLTALRELALRFVAERMDRRLREQSNAPLDSRAWRSTDRLLVAVGPSPSSADLVRRARRLAAAQGIPWLAVSVESPRLLSPRARQRLDENLALARALGAEIVVTQDEDVANALVRTARQHSATQILAGRSRNPRWLDWLNGGSTADRLLRMGKEFDVHVAPRGRIRDGEAAGERPHRRALSPFHEYFLALLVLAGISLLGVLIVAHVGLNAVGLVYLMGIVLLSLRVGRGPVLMAGVLSALVWDFLFIPPVLSLHIGQTEDLAMFSAYFVVTLVTGELTARIRNNEQNERSRELRATAMYRLTLALSDAPGPNEAVGQALNLCRELFDASAALFLVDETTGALVLHPSTGDEFVELDRSVADWAVRNRRPAGRFTDTFASSTLFATPLVRGKSALGVLCLRVAEDGELSLAQRDLAEGIAAQLAMFVERDRLRAAGERGKLVAESERLHRTLLDGVSHELKTPLAVLAAAVERMGSADETTRRELLDEVDTATRRLTRLVNNLLDQTRLESGALRPRIDWCEAGELVTAAADSVHEALEGHPFAVSLQPGIPLFRADFVLMEQVLTNLLLNASLHTPPGTPVSLTAAWDRKRGQVCFTVADRGPGAPASLKDRLFRKFQRGESARVGGLGLGLSIVHGFVLAHGGEVVVDDNPGGGAVFAVYLPCEEPGNLEP